jgi:hypothetical protein
VDELPSIHSYDCFLLSPLKKGEEYSTLSVPSHSLIYVVPKLYNVNPIPATEVEEKR